MKIDYVGKLRLSNENEMLMDLINEIIEDFQEQGYVLTLRQLYYQLVSCDVIPNSDKEYAKLSKLLGKGRMAGRVDWDAIEDRLRVPYLPYSVRGIKHALKDTIDQYRLNRQKDQEVYMEVWVEKDALSGVLKRVTEKYHINLMVNRGYSSITAMRDAYMRFRSAWQYRMQDVKILYLGDHDPSGIDMLRDIQNRIERFMDGEPDNDFQMQYQDGNTRFEVIPVALTMAQIEQYNPPPNPAKMSDSRARDYIAEYGKVSWEVDALSPSVLIDLLETEILLHLDIKTYEQILKKEQDQISELISTWNRGIENEIFRL